MRHKPFVLLDDARPGRERLRFYCDHQDTIAAKNLEDVMLALARIERAVNEGRHAAGYFSYELGYALEPKLARLMPDERTHPLLWFGIFGSCTDIYDDEADAFLARHVEGRAYAGPLEFAESEESYGAKFARVKDYIAAGDIYQVNLTFPASFRFAGDPLALYRRLRPRARSGHGAFIDDGTRQILSLSPESFFALRDGRVTARPMKGTAPRGRDGHEDAQLKARLQASEKDRAENLMIVDLIRNDIGRVAVTGSVEVEDLFAIETYPTVHQMVSTVHAELRPGMGPADIVRALFPCGSVTGTPKIRAMEIIRELEPTARGVYCGAIGAFGPDGAADFNVAIRTITIEGNNGRLNVGGAVVADSTAHGEYEECLVKARYFTEARDPLYLFETLRYSADKGFVRAPMHLARLQHSAAAIGIPFDPMMSRILLETVRGPEDLRVRLSLDETGHFAVAAEAMADAKGPWTFEVSDHRVDSADMLARHKTSWRELYDGERERVRRNGCDEAVFLNERGELVEGSITNIFLRLGGRMVTPPLTSGCLDGCLRRELIERGEVQEEVLTADDLLRADAIYLGNSLRGLIEALPAAPFCERRKP